jgi:hypothetical protein
VNELAKPEIILMPRRYKPSGKQRQASPGVKDLSRDAVDEEWACRPVHQHTSDWQLFQNLERRVTGLKHVPCMLVYEQGTAHVRQNRLIKGHLLRSE